VCSALPSLPGTLPPPSNQSINHTLTTSSNTASIATTISVDAMNGALLTTALPSSRLHRAVFWCRCFASVFHARRGGPQAGALSEAVESYLQCNGWDFARGKDGAGRGGAFAVFGWF